jgi:hypothetical protein
MLQTESSKESCLAFSCHAYFLLIKNSSFHFVEFGLFKDLIMFGGPSCLSDGISKPVLTVTLLIENDNFSNFVYISYYLYGILQRIAFSNTICLPSSLVTSVYAGQGRQVIWPHPESIPKVGKSAAPTRGKSAYV